MDQLEDVDSCDSDVHLTVVDCDVPSRTWQADAGGRQFLFAQQMSTHSASLLRICLRYDVDACIWQLNAERIEDKVQLALTHTNTIDALGYVQVEYRKKCKLSNAINAGIENATQAYTL